MLETKQDLLASMEQMKTLRQEIGKVIVGQEEVVTQLLWALVAGGHALLEGIPGLGKTMLVRTVSEALDLQFSRIQFTPDLMPADITGTNVMHFAEGGGASMQFQRGPIFGNIVLADEINRATPKTQSALLEAMQEQTVTAGGVTFALPRPFFVLATQNPIEQEGTYPLPEAQMDRFILKINVSYPKKHELIQIVRRASARESVQVEKVMNSEELREIQHYAREVLVSHELMEKSAELIMGTHPNFSATADIQKYVRYGAGPRGMQALVAVAKVRALLAGNLNVSWGDIAAVSLPTLRHRMVLSYEGMARGIAIDELIQGLLEQVGKK
jgi:MoxR-like ATPase